MTDPLDIYGVDLDWGNDLEPTGRLVRGFKLLGQAAFHRLSTPRGACQDAPDDGLDIAEYLHVGLTPAELNAIPGDIASELRKDERFSDAEVTLTETSPGVFRVTIRITTSAGPTFDLVLVVADAAVKLLKLEGENS